MSKSGAFYIHGLPKYAFPNCLLKNKTTVESYIIRLSSTSNTTDRTTWHQKHQSVNTCNRGVCQVGYDDDDSGIGDNVKHVQHRQFITELLHNHITALLYIIYL